MAKGKELPQGFYWRGAVIWLRTDPINGRPISTKSKTLDGASAFLAERERRSVNPLHKAATQATVGEWAKNTCEVKRKTKSEGTLQMYEQKLGHVVRIFGAHSPMMDIDAKAVDRFIDQRQKEGVTNNTIHRELTCMMQMLKLARRNGAFHLEISQVKPFGFSADYVPRKTHLKPDELPVLLAAPGMTPERVAWVCLALATGGDISDVERVQAGDYDPETQTIQMRGTKTRFRSARIPVPDMYQELLERSLPYLPLSWPRVSKDLPEICERVGITRVTPKDLRRTASTWLKAAGVALDVLGRWMRHGGAKVAFDVYDQSSAEVTGDAIRRQTQDRHTAPGPLAELGRRGGLKSRRENQDSAENSGNSQSLPVVRKPKQGDADAEVLQRAEARVRRLRPLLALDPGLAGPLAIAESVVEAYHLGAGDPDAQANLTRLLKTAADHLGMSAEVA
jgi:integrase